MYLLHIVSNNIGLVHLLASIIALITGTIVLLTTKGTRSHKQIGYAYTLSMAIVLATSFMMYNLYGKFGLFHWLALVSTVTLIGGIVPMLRRKPKGYVTMHFSFMFWSVFGLYGAFIAEVLVRIPKNAVTTQGTINPMFYNMVGLAVFLVMGLAYVLFKKKKKTWQQFDKSQAHV